MVQVKEPEPVVEPEAKQVVIEKASKVVKEEVKPETPKEVPVVEDIFVPTGTEPREESAVAEGSKERPETRGLLDLTTPENTVDFAL